MTDEPAKKQKKPRKTKIAVLEEQELNPRFRYRYIERNCPKMLDEGAIIWAGEVDIPTLCGEAIPRSWDETQSKCYFVCYMMEGAQRIGKAVKHVKRRSGMHIITVKTPDQSEMQQGRGKVGYVTEVPYNNILWALHYSKRERIKGGIEQRTCVSTGMIGKLNENIRTHAAVFGPTPSIDTK